MMDPYVQQAIDEIDRATGHLTVEQIAREVPGKWSVAGILEHLTLAYSAGVRLLDTALATGERSVRTPRVSQWMARTLVVDCGYFPRVKAPAATVPDGTIHPAEVRRAAREALSTLDALMTRAADRFGDDIPVMNHPYFGGMSVRQWRKFHWRHTVHHMRQARARAAE
ncbi:MAG: DUF1569 domain-containing protein [Acidobacteriota bacterium]